MTQRAQRRLTRRRLLAGSASAVAGWPLLRASQRPHVVVLGGGFAGASAARALLRAQPDLRVTLIDAHTTYTACPLSNLVIAGERDLGAQQFGYSGLARDGIMVHIDTALAVDASAHQVRLASGRRLTYDRLIMAPGISVRWDELSGYDPAAAQVMPHAWQAGAQTLLLRQQLQAMPDGGLVVIAVPDNPYRCPPGPYERASLIAYYLQQHKPRAKLLILDAKDTFSKQPLFQAAWRELYGDLVQWHGLSDGARVIAVDASRGQVQSEFETFTPAVANIIPPQQAGPIAARAGVADRSGWCPIDPLTFESTLVADIHVIGDAAIANAMPKSAFAANAQAKVCAVQVARLLHGHAPLHTTLLNTCYSLVAPDYGISVAGVYRPGNAALLEVDGAGGTSPADASATLRAAEAGYAHDWFRTISAETFG